MLMLAGVFYITLSLANYPSKIIADALFWVETKLNESLFQIGVPEYFVNLVQLKNQVKDLILTLTN